MDGNYQRKHEARAIAYFRDALDDLGCGDDLLKTHHHSKALFHFQQSIEKAMKSCLAIWGKLFVQEHRCSNLFKTYIFPVLSEELNEGFKEIMSTLRELECYYITTRYSVTTAGEIRLEEYNEKDVRDASSIARKCLDLTYSFIEEKISKTLPRDLDALTAYLKEDYSDIVI